MSEVKYMTGAEFKLHFQSLLRTLKDNDRITFGSGDLSFATAKERGPIEGPRIVQIQFNEVYTVMD